MKDMYVTSKRYYELEDQDWSQVWTELKPAEIRILFHLRTLASLGNSELALSIRELGRTLNMVDATVSQALQILNEKGYITVDLVQVNVKVHSRLIPQRKQRWSH